MSGSTFLLQFQEKLAIKKMNGNNPSPVCSQTGTETCTFTREERDQDKSTLSLEPRTMTRTREEPDQDFSNGSYTTLPRY